MPCYNEGARLDRGRLLSFLEAHPDVTLVPVDDGSTDDTWDVLRQIAESNPDRVAPLQLERNRGKAEAVRRGMVDALSRPTDYAGYWDADLSTPLAEIPRFVSELEQRPEVQVVLGARVALVGRDIQRDALRHYVGRIFATCAAATLKLRIYDTQCGAKLLRNTTHVRAAFDQPFQSNWAFDVELLARLLTAFEGSTGAADRQLWELPLDTWHDVEGSKVKPLDLPRSLLELARIRRRYPALANRD